MFTVSVDGQCAKSHQDGGGGHLMCMKSHSHKGVHLDAYKWWWLGPFHSRRPALNPY